MPRPQTAIVIALAVSLLALAGCVTRVNTATTPAPAPATVVVSTQPMPAPVAVPGDAPASGPRLMRAPKLYEPRGFIVYDEDGRYWVFQDGSDALAEYRTKGEPAKRVTKIGVGPEGKTVMSDDGAVIDAYLAAMPAEYLKPVPSTMPAVAEAPEGPARVVALQQPGFAVFEEDGRLWVFREGSEELGQFMAKGEPAKRVTKIGVGPGGRTVMAENTETIDDYLKLMGGPFDMPGFKTFEEDGRLWIFREGSEGLANYLEKGEPAKRVTKIGVGPGGRSVMSDSTETIDAYLAAMPSPYAKPGFEVFEEDGRLWIFEAGSDALQEYLEKGEPAKRVTKIGVGPDGKTLIGPDTETLDAYLQR